MGVCSSGLVGCERIAAGRRVDNHDHSALTVRFDGLRAVEPDGVCVVDGHGEHLSLSVGVSTLIKGK